MKARSDPIDWVERWKDRMNAVTTNGRSAGGLRMKRSGSPWMREIKKKWGTMPETRETQRLASADHPAIAAVSGGCVKHGRRNLTGVVTTR